MHIGLTGGREDAGIDDGHERRSREETADPRARPEGAKDGQAGTEEGDPHRDEDEG
jgi:hypothetical protein